MEPKGRINKREIKRIKKLENGLFLGEATYTPTGRIETRLFMEGGNKRGVRANTGLARLLQYLLEKEGEVSEAVISNSVSLNPETIKSYIKILRTPIQREYNKTINFSKSKGNYHIIVKDTYPSPDPENDSLTSSSL